MFPRIREITDAMGARLRVAVEAHPSGALVSLERPDEPGMRVLMGSYGVEILWGFIMSARLAVESQLPDEVIGGDFPSRFQLLRNPHPAIRMTQSELERPFDLPATFWDRLFAELCLVTAHSRELTRRIGTRLQ